MSFESVLNHAVWRRLCSASARPIYHFKALLHCHAERDPQSSSRQPMETAFDKTSSPERHTSLPQYGFGPEFAFRNLVEQNPFLFRVYTPKQRSPFYDTTEPFFVGQKFDECYTRSPDLLVQPQESITQTCTYRDVAIHMDWTTRSSSPFITTSFSFVWSIWEALRRYQTSVKHDIEIAVIDAKAVADHAVTALELLRHGKREE